MAVAVQRGQFQAVGQRISGYIQFMTQVPTLSGTSAEAKERRLVPEVSASCSCVTPRARLICRTARPTSFAVPTFMLPTGNILA